MTFVTPRKISRCYALKGQPSLQDQLEQIICYVLNIKKSHSGLCTKEITKKIIFCPHFIDLKSVVMISCMNKHLQGNNRFSSKADLLSSQFP